MQSGKTVRPPPSRRHRPVDERSIGRSLGPSTHWPRAAALGYRCCLLGHQPDLAGGPATRSGGSWITTNAVDSTTLVGLMGQLSNPAADFTHACDQGLRGHERRKDVDAGAARRDGPGNRQAQRRLGRADVERLVAAYEEGNSVAQLVARFNVNRTTVLAHLDRNSVPRRQTGPRLSAEDVAQAAGLYRDGLSLAAIGQRFRVNASTVGKALRRADVQIRPRRGWASA